MPEATDANNGTQNRTLSIQGIREIIERTFLAGMGAAALTKDRIEELVDELVNRGQINADEGRAVVDRLVARSREEARAVLRKADTSLHSAYRELGLSSKEDLEDLALRLRRLEHRVELLEAQSDQPCPKSS